MITNADEYLQKRRGSNKLLDGPQITLHFKYLSFGSSRFHTNISKAFSFHCHDNQIFVRVNIMSDFRRDNNFYFRLIRAKYIWIFVKCVLQLYNWPGTQNALCQNKCVPEKLTTQVIAVPVCNSSLSNDCCRNVEIFPVCVQELQSIVAKKNSSHCFFQTISGNDGTVI